MHEFYMRQALLLAREAAGAGEVPVVNYGEDTYEIEDMMAEALQKIIDGIDMDVVLESTFATVETADREIEGR